MLMLTHLTKKIFQALIVLVVLLFVVRYPTDIVALANLFIQAASSLAGALQGVFHSLIQSLSSSK